MRRTLAIGVGLGLVALVVLGAVATRLGVLAPLPRPDGPWAWVATRAAGVTALVALWLDVMVGLAMSTGALDRLIARARSLELHQALGRMALGFTAGHVALLLLDGAVRFDALDVLVPGMADYRPVATGAGIVAAYLAVVVHVSFGLRGWLGPRTWRRLHGLAFVALVGALGHGLVAGSDTSAPAMRTFYTALAAGVAALSTVRIMRWAHK